MLFPDRRPEEDAFKLARPMLEITLVFLSEGKWGGP